MEPTAAVGMRIRFAGSHEAETFHMDSAEYARLNSDWKSYLTGNSSRGGEYQCQDGDQSVELSLNFELIAYIEPGKVY